MFLGLVQPSTILWQLVLLLAEHEVGISRHSHDLLELAEKGESRAIP